MPAELMCTNSRCGRLFVDVAGLRPLSGTRFCLVTHAAAKKCGPIHRPAQSKYCRLMFSAHAPRINLSLPTTTLPTASHDLWLTSSVTTVEERTLWRATSVVCLAISAISEIKEINDISRIREILWTLQNGPESFSSISSKNRGNSRKSRKSRKKGLR